MEDKILSTVDRPQGLKKGLAGVGVSDGCCVQHRFASVGAGLPHEGVAGGRVDHLTGVYGGEWWTPQDMAGGEEPVVVELAQAGGSGVGEVEAVLLYVAHLLAQGGRREPGVGAHQLILLGRAGTHGVGGAAGGQGGEGGGQGAAVGQAGQTNQEDEEQLGHGDCGYRGKCGRRNCWG